MAETIGREELKRRLEEQEDLVLIEVLSEREYRRAHIKAAINIPFKEIAHRARDRFEPEQPIVVYCADRQCRASPIAAEKLEQSGFRNVREYRGGKQDWEQAGYPMVRGVAPGGVAERRGPEAEATAREQE
ncbi:MAG: rhodanese-like domain-containing protein [Spirochaetales bacterium]|nr:rhodanese-like domain-containing protein [Spirochaetales bacterium]